MYGALAWTVDRLYRMLRPAIFALTDPERAHDLACRAIRSLDELDWLAEIVWRFGYAGDRKLDQTIGGVYFPNPFGLPAGFDKTGEIASLLHLFGFGFVEAGTFTLPARKGNPKRPRLERIPEKRGLINQMGWNNPGAEAGSQNLAIGARSVPVIVNVGPTPNVDSADEAIASVVSALKVLAPRANAITLNPSCSNVNIVNFQDPALLAEFLDAITVSGVTKEKLILVKLDPDTTEGELGKIGSVCLARKAGLVLGNTRRTSHGALSGPALHADMLERIGYVHREFGGELVTIACGGIETADQAYKAIKRGAYLVQGLTGWIYGGPFWPREIAAGLSRLVERDELDNISEARGMNQGR